MVNRALFLDRDGVINVNYGYVHQRKDVDFIDGIFDLVATAKKYGYLVVIVTNQAGIGRGYYSEVDFHNLMNWMCEQFLDHAGLIDAVYFCPDHPEHGIGEYLRKSHFRKPGPGMILKAKKDFDIDLSKSIMVGDKITDIEAGVAAGIKTLLYFGVEQEVGTAIRVNSLVDALPFIYL